jgi:sugar phosphate permease
VFRRIFTVTWLAYFGFYLCRKNFSVLMPFLKMERGYTSEALAHVLFVYSLAYAGGQFLMGGIADRLGSRLVVTAGALFSAASSALTGTLAPLVLLQGINGLAQSSGWPGLLKMTGTWFPASNRGVIMAWWGTHMVLGGAAAASLAAWATQGDWKRGAWVPALFLGVIAAVFGLLGADRPGPKKEKGRAARAPLVLNPPLISIAAMYFCVKMTRYAFLFWLPLYMTEFLRYKPSDAGYASSVYELIGFLGVLLAGYVSEKTAKGARFPVAAIMMFGLAVLCAAYPRLSQSGSWINLGAIALMGAFTFGPDTLMAGAGTQEAAPPEAAGRAAGFVNGVGSLGQVVSPYLVAMVSARYGWPAIFNVLGGVALLGGLALTTQWRRL